MKAKHANIFAHYHPSEYPFVERCLDWIDRAIYHYQEIHTPFLDPREREILIQLSKRESELMFRMEGGSDEAERCRIQLGVPQVIEFAPPIPISFLRITPKSQTSLEHRQVLGSILGLGIRRNQLGDLYPHVDGCDVIVTGEISSYIRLYLERIGREKVQVEEIAKEELRREQPKIQFKKAIVSSLRLDTVVSEGYHLSRAQASKLIRAGKCKVDWRITDKPDFLVNEGNLLSLRGYGRMRLEKLEQRTRKGKWLVCFAYLAGNQ